MVRKLVAAALALAGLVAIVLMIGFALEDSKPGAQGPSAALYIGWFATSAAVVGSSLLGGRSSRRRNAFLGIAAIGIAALVAVMVVDPPTIRTSLLA